MALTVPGGLVEVAPRHPADPARLPSQVPEVPRLISTGSAVMLLYNWPRRGLSKCRFGRGGNVRDKIDHPIGGKRKPFTVIEGGRVQVHGAARLPDPTKIPPRPWLYGTQLLRGYVSVLAGQRGIGKTSYAMSLGLALASGQSIFGNRVYQRCSVAILDLEHHVDECEYRLAALMIRHRIDIGAVGNRFCIQCVHDGLMTTILQAEVGCRVAHPIE